MLSEGKFMSKVIKKEHIKCLELLKETLEQQLENEFARIEYAKQKLSGEVFQDFDKSLEKLTMEELYIIDFCLNIENKIPKLFLAMLKKGEQFDFRDNGFAQWELKSPSETITWDKDYFKHYDTKYICHLDFMDRYTEKGVYFSIEDYHGSDLLFDLSIKLFGMNYELNNIANVSFKSSKFNTAFDIDLEYSCKEKDNVKICLSISNGKNNSFSGLFKLTEEQIEKYGIEPEELRLPF